MTMVVERWMERPLRQFVDDAGVLLVLISRTSGQVLGQVGFTKAVDVMSACALAAAINASASELGRMLDGKPFAGLHQVNRHRQAVLMNAATRRGAYLCLAIFDDTSSFGVVRLYLEELRASLSDAAPPAEELAMPALPEDFEHDLNRNLALMFGKTL